MKDLRQTVARFWLQETKTFPDGAPQREEYEADAAFEYDCLKYEREWRETYICGNEQCQDRSCPHHFPSRQRS